MNVFEDYLKKIDEHPFDAEDVLDINRAFQEVCTQLSKEGKEDFVKTADLDRQVFSVQKSVEKKRDIEKGTLNGLGWNMSGEETKEDGTKTPIYWPDVTKYTQQDFEYFQKRYNECKNLFARTEYGLMVYFGERTNYSKHHDFKKQLYNDLLELSKYYLNKANEGGQKNNYVLHFFPAIKHAFNIAEKGKLTNEIKICTEYIYNVHQSWDITKGGTLRILLDLSGLMAEYYSLFTKIIDFQCVIDKNMQGAIELEKTYVWGAIYAIDKNILIEQKRNKNATELIKYKANLYEKLCDEADKKNNMAAVDFCERALRLYMQINDIENISRLEKKYGELRGKFSMGEVRQELPKEQTEEINNKLIDAVKNCTEEEILLHFIYTPWFYKIKDIEEQANEIWKNSVLLSILPASIIDKFGNKIDAFQNDTERKEYNFWNTYMSNFQIGTQTMHKFFIKAFEAGKLNYNIVIKFLENAWYNDEIERMYNGKKIRVKPIDTLRPGIKKIFEELDNFYKDKENYQCDFVTIIDSLTLKIEGLLRFFCEKIGIATFKPRTKGGDELVMEKLLDDLLVDIKHRPNAETNFQEDDRILVKYVMTEKVGLNLRNQVAHSLMDVHEYNFHLVVILFCTIFKLSNYQFVDKQTI